MNWYRGRSNFDMVENLKKKNIITSKIVADTMEAVDRGKYAERNPYDDAPQGIGYNVTISAPHMHAMALELLKNHLVPGARALDVGSGSGYLTACMGLMVSPNGVAVGIDHIEELVELSISNILSDNPELVRDGRVQLLVGDGRLGYPALAPYQAIHVGAAAFSLPAALVDQLAPGGRLIIPIGQPGGAQSLDMIDKNFSGQLTRKSITMVNFVPLIDKNLQWPGRWR